MQIRTNNELIIFKRAHHIDHQDDGRQQNRRVKINILALQRNLESLYIPLLSLSIILGERLHADY